MRPPDPKFSMFVATTNVTLGSGIKNWVLNTRVLIAITAIIGLRTSFIYNLKIPCTKLVGKKSN